MKIEDLLNYPHRFFDGGVKEYGIKGHDHGCQGSNFKDNAHPSPHILYSSTTKWKVKYETNRKVRSKANRIFNQE